ncbi:50S ribosomal protein L18 [Marinilabilia sp.]|uniref:50S ribosomal protein L18 n=1 Tax=Marinilabilia sp. TaxID=2021252 RepID=UPI0025BC5400|nr:50S ribosomal protein L18 [Marinilabilia sp.]
MAFSKQNRRLKIKKRVRKNISGTAEKPRMSVYRSNKQISVQLIDDKSGNTLVAASSLLKDIAAESNNKSDKSALVGKMIAERAKSAGIENVVFDRNGYLYHGRVKQLADAARDAGLKF